MAINVVLENWVYTERKVAIQNASIIIRRSDTNASVATATSDVNGHWGPLTVDIQPWGAGVYPDVEVTYNSQVRIDKGGAQVFFGGAALAGGLTLTSTGLTVAAGGITVTGASTITGPTADNTTNALIVRNSTPSNLLTIRDDGLVTVNPTSIAGGGLAVTAGGITVTGASITLSSGRGLISAAATDYLDVDPGGLVGLRVQGVASAVNYVQATNSATGTRPRIDVLGTDADIGLSLITKGIGPLVVLSAGSTQILSQFVPVASAVNYLEIQNAATTVGPALFARGTDANVPITFQTKGTGQWSFNPATGANVFVIAPVASGVNGLQITGAATGASPVLSAIGGDANVGITLTPKGTGVVAITSGVNMTGDNSTFRAATSTANVLRLSPSDDLNPNTTMLWITNFNSTQVMWGASKSGATSQQGTMTVTNGGVSVTGTSSIAGVLTVTAGSISVTDGTNGLVQAAGTVGDLYLRPKNSSQRVVMDASAGLSVNTGGVTATVAAGVAGVNLGAGGIGINNPRIVHYDDANVASYISFDSGATTYFRNGGNFSWQLVPTGATRYSAAGTTLMSLSTTGVAAISGGLTVSAGGLTVTGNSTINGTLGGLTGLTVAGPVTFSGGTVIANLPSVDIGNTAGQGLSASVPADISGLSTTLVSGGVYLASYSVSVQDTSAATNIINAFLRDGTNTTIARSTTRVTVPGNSEASLCRTMVFTANNTTLKLTVQANNVATTQLGFANLTVVRIG